MKKNSFFAIFHILIATALFAQDDVQFSASAPRVVVSGEQFQLKYTLNTRPQSITPPDFTGFIFRGGPSTSSSSSVQIINGQITQSTTITYTYLLQASDVGTINILPASAVINGTTYNSNSLEIEVIKGAGTTPSAQAPGERPSASSASGEDLYVRLHVNKREVYQGEAIIATLKIYSRSNISGIERAEIPSFRGFYQQEIEVPQLRSLERENVNGEIYGTGILKRYVLFPQQSGELIIDPFKMDIVVPQRVTSRSRSIFEDFFGSSYQNVRKPISSNPVTIKVKPLPAGRPVNFSGGVGNFNFQSSIDQINVKQNDPITLKYTLSGNGNLRLIDQPKVDFPPDFETYEPKITENISNTTSGASGSRTFEYLLIPRRAGQFRIPPATFSYFNPSENRYRTITTKEILIDVERSETDTTPGLITGLSREDIRVIGQDIRYIKTDGTVFKENNKTLFGSRLFYSVYLVGFLAFSLIIILMNKRIKENANIELVKNKKANKIAKKRLKKAHYHLNNQEYELFHEAVLKACWGYLSDKLNIPTANLTKELAVEKLKIRGVDQGLIDLIIDLLNECEFARYAIGHQNSETKKTYENAVSILSKIEQNMKHP